MKVFITGDLPIVAEKQLKKAGFTVKINRNQKQLTKAELISGAKNADAVISLLSNKIDMEVIDCLSKCRVIANYAVGYNNIDLEYARKKNIIVTNTPDVLTDATADIAMGLILAVTRRFYESEKLVRDKKFVGWQPKLLLGSSLQNKTLGIIGAGRIGYATALRAKAFGMKIIYFSRSRNEDFDEKLNAKKVSLPKLMNAADVISLHLPLNERTKNIVNSKMLDLMKSSSGLINTARGEVLNEIHLIKLLKKKKIFGAGFDVYQNEPEINHELLKLENVYLLPHIGSATIEARNQMAEIAAQNVINVLNGKKPITPV
ncbi:MAG: D-glycerate dehydrogenase [Bacteroidetes bacterium]|nr:D-glycerate dehydrogenase [Bacteroidota bacterium]